MVGGFRDATASRSFASGPGWLEPVGDGKTPAGTRKGELTGARGSLGQILILSTFHRHEPRWRALLQLRWCQVRAGWNERSKAALLCVTAQSWEDRAGPSPIPSPRVSEQIFCVRKEGLLDPCPLTALLPWALQPKWTQSQGPQQLGFWNMLTFNGQQIPTDPQTKVCLEEVVAEGLRGENR